MFGWFTRKKAVPPPAAAPVLSEIATGLDAVPFDLAAPEPAAAPEMGEVATTLDGRDITRGWLSSTMQLPSQDPLLEKLGGGLRYDLYREVLSDWQVKSTYQQRQMALTACEWTVEAGGERRADKNAAALVKGALEHVGFDRATTGMQFGVFYGFAVAECLLVRDGGTIGLDAIKVRDRRRFAYLPDGSLRLLTTQNPNTGEALPPRKFWSFATGADHDDEPYGMGLAHWLYWPVLFKRGNIRFWLAAAEKFGTPTAVGWFPPGTSQEDRNKLLSALKAIQIDAAIILPDGMKAELLEAKRASGIDYQELCVYLDQAIAKITLGQVMTSEAVGGQYKADVQNDVRRELIKADADLICESFNRGPVRWLTDWNYPGAAYPRVFRQTEPPDDLNGRADRERKLFDLGYRPTLKEVEEVYGGEWEEVPKSEPPAATPPTAPPPPDAASADPNAPAPNFAAPTVAPPPTAPLADRLGREANPLIEQLLAPVRTALADSADLTDFRERLQSLYPELDGQAFAELMGQALAVADAAGYWEAGDGR